MAAEVSVFQLVPVALLFGISWAFWLTYRNPGRNELTRFLEWYVEAERFPAIDAKTATLAVVVVTMGIAVATLAFVLGRLAAA